MKSLFSSRRIFSIALLLATLAGVLAGTGNAQAASHNTWQIIPSANGSQAFNRLTGVAAVSNNDVWAVGRSLNDSVQSLIEHWNGSSWQTVSTPDNGLVPELNAVAAIPGTKQVWAVGDQFAPSTGVQPLIERWDGSSWQIIPSPLLLVDDGGATNILHSVFAISKDNAWATGVYHKSDTQPQAELIEHWDGQQWSVVLGAPIPGVTNSWLYGITACSANNVWAVGSAIGTGGANTLIEHWNGQSWQLVEDPNPGIALYGVTCIPGTEQLWTVGNSFGGTLIERWDGSSWTIVASPNLGTLSSVTALSAHNAWAVGSSTSQGFIEHWNGTTWNVVSQPVIATRNELNAIAHVPGTDRLWAVGDFSPDINSQSTLIERYS